jgi:hypothetical protein
MLELTEIANQSSKIVNQPTKPTFKTKNSQLNNKIKYTN